MRFFPGINKDDYVRRIVEESNSYFYDKFLKIPFHERMLFLPYCLRGRDCPTEIDQENGLQCHDSCDLDCKLKEFKKLALNLGYKGVHIVVSGRLHKNQGILRSKNFLMRQIELHRPRGVIGCLCTQDLREKYLSPKNLSPKGTLGNHGINVIPQVVLLSERNCKQSSVDWTELRNLIEAQA